MYFRDSEQIGPEAQTGTLDWLGSDNVSDKSRDKGNNCALTGKNCR